MPDTVAYLALGLGVSAVVAGTYLVTLWLRFRSNVLELRVIEDLNAAE
jgi:hypothetical protein